MGASFDPGNGLNRRLLGLEHLNAHVAAREGLQSGEELLRGVVEDRSGREQPGVSLGALHPFRRAIPEGDAGDIPLLVGAVDDPEVIDTLRVAVVCEVIKRLKGRVGHGVVLSVEGRAVMARPVWLLFLVVGGHAERDSSVKRHGLDLDVEAVSVSVSPS